MNIVKIFAFIYLIIFQFKSVANENDFNKWLLSFKEYAKKEGISSKTLNEVMDKAVFLPKVIEYDRYQPEFYEDTFTYIGKRVTKSKLKKGYKKK